MVLDYKRCITLESRAHVTLQPYGQTLPIILVRHWDYRSIGAKPELVRVTVRWNFSGSAFLRTEKKWEARNSSGPEKSSFPAKKFHFRFQRRWLASVSPPTAAAASTESRGWTRASRWRSTVTSTSTPRTPTSSKGRWGDRRPRETSRRRRRRFRRSRLTASTKGNQISHMWHFNTCVMEFDGLTRIGPPS